MLYEIYLPTCYIQRQTCDGCVLTVNTNTLRWNWNCRVLQFVQAKSDSETAEICSQIGTFQNCRLWVLYPSEHPTQNAYEFCNHLPFPHCPRGGLVLDPDNIPTIQQLNIDS